MTAFDIPSLLASYKAAPPTNDNMNIARYVLTHANVDWNRANSIKLPGYTGPGATQQTPKSPSVLSRIFDIMSRPGYAVSEAAHQLINQEVTRANPNTGVQEPIDPQAYHEGDLSKLGDIIHGAISGLAGTKKTNMAQNLTELNPNASPLARYGGGLVLDTVTDPTTYVGPGLVKNIFKGIKDVAVGAKDVSQAIPEAKGLVSIVKGVAKTPAIPTAESPVLPDALSRIKPTPLPDFHSPGSVVSSQMLGDKFPKVNIPVAHNARPISTIENLASPVESSPSKLRPDQIDTLAGGSSRKASQILKSIYGEKGYTLNARNIEKTLSGLPKSAIGDYVQEAQKLPVSEKGVAATEAAKETRVANMAKGRALAKPLVNPISGSPNLVRAGDILDKLRSGDINSLSNVVKPEIEAGVATGPQKVAALAHAKEFSEKVLSKPNKFATGDKIPLTNNPAQQANFYQRLLTKVAPPFIKGATKPNAAKYYPARAAFAYRMLKEAEPYFESVGHKATYWDGSHLKLSDVIDQLGGPKGMSKELMTQVLKGFKTRDPSKIINPDIRQAIENLRANDAIKQSKWVRLAVDQNTQKANVAEQVLSKPKHNAFIKQLLSDNKKVMQFGTDTSPVGISSTQHLLRTIMQKQGTLPQLATDSKKTYIQLYSSGTKNLKWLPAQAAQTSAIAKTLGTQSAKALGSQLDSKTNSAQQWFMTRFATWYGQKDLRPDVLINTQTAINNATARAKIWNQIAKQYTPDEISEAFKVAQGVAPNPSTPHVANLGSQLQRAMENLFASTGVSDEATKASSTALRSGALIRDLNRQLTITRSLFKFTNAKDVEDFMGNSHDYSKGVDWLKSWESADIKDPLDFIMRVETATEQLMHQYSFLDEAAARWGSPVKSSVFNTAVEARGAKVATKVSKTYPAKTITTKAGKIRNIAESTKDVTAHVPVGRLDGVYFSKDIADQMNRVFDTWHQIYNPKSPLLKFLDSTTRAWKSGVTIYAPSHHIRNLIGDNYMSWLAGVNNPRSASTAMRVLHSQKDRYSSLSTINDLTDKNALKRVLTRPGDPVLHTKSGIPLTAEQVYLAAHQTGLLHTARYTEDLTGNPLARIHPFNGNVRHVAEATSELVDHQVRLTHFVDLLKKSKETDLQKMFNDSSKIVRKWHPDGMDLTDFERNVVKRILPFYSWTRKTIPLIIEGALTRPGKVISYPRAQYALQGSLGIQSPSPSDPFPEDQLFPNWIKSKGIGPILGSAGNYGIVNPGNPFNDIVSQFAGTGKIQDPVQGIAGMVNPLFKIPAELGTGQTTLGQPVYKDLNAYATNNLPQISLLSRLFNMGIAGPTQKSAKAGDTNWNNIINLLTGLGYQPTAPYIKEAQFEKKNKLQ